MTLAFLKLLFDGKQKAHNVLIWQKNVGRKGGTSSWFTDLKKAATFAEKQSKTTDVYFGIALASEAPPAHKAEHVRVKETEAAAVAGLWCEVDYLDGVAHKKGNLPPTPEAALQLIHEMPRSPSSVVHSGHGYQAYWLFPQLLLLNSPEERTKFKTLNEQWQRLFKRNAEEHGWDNDSTFDLARIYRPAGTKNHKQIPVKDVAVVEESDVRYTVAELQAMIDAQAKPVIATHTNQQTQLKERAAEIGELMLDPKAVPPFEKFEMLAENEIGFKNAYHRKAKKKDMSASAYDLSIANYCVRAGWTDQEIVDTCIAARRKHKDELKLRQDYYTVTLAKARAGIEQEDDEMEGEADPIKFLRTTLAGTVKGKELELPLKQVIKRGGDYDFQLMDGTLCTLGTSANVLMPAKVQAAIMDGCGLVIQDFTKAKWRPIAQRIADAAVFIETSSEEIETRSWLESYMKNRTGVHRNLDDADALLQAIDNMRDGNLTGFADQSGRFYLRLDNFINHITLDYGARTTQRDAANRLSRLGFHREQLSARDGERTPKVRVWISPEGFVDVADEDESNKAEKERTEKIKKSLSTASSLIH